MSLYTDSKQDLDTIIPAINHTPWDEGHFKQWGITVVEWREHVLQWVGKKDEILSLIHANRSEPKLRKLSVSEMIG
jgi:hypothetical protein